MKTKTNEMRLRHIAVNLHRCGKESAMLQEFRDFWQSSYCLNGLLFWQGCTKTVSWKAVGGGCGFILAKEME